MTYLEQSQPGPGRGGSRRRLLAVVPVLLSLFLAALGVFTLLVRQDRAPRVDLPEVLGVAKKSKPTFSRTLADVARPIAVAVSPDGSRIYAVEGAGPYVVKAFDASGAPLADLTPPHTTEFTRLPIGVAVAPDGAVYVIDQRLRQVLIFEADGTYRDALRPAGVDEWAPSGIAFDAAGQIYVSDAYDLPGVQRHRVLIFKMDGTLVRAFGQKGSAPSDLMFPSRLAVDGLGRIWVGDITGVKVFGPDGAFLFRLSDEGDQAVALPGGLAYFDGAIYATDTINHTALVFDATQDVPKSTARLGELGFGKGQLRYPSGIAVSAKRIYIANRENGRIDTWTR